MTGLIQPVLVGDDLRRQIDATDPKVGAALWWLGQSGFLVKSGGETVLFDPYLSDSLTEKYRDTDRPHERMTARAIAPEQLQGLTLVTSSHAHTDHLDAATLLPLLAQNPSAPLVFPEATRHVVAERIAGAANELHGMDHGKSLARRRLTVTAVPAAHETIERDGNDRVSSLGYVVRMPGVTVYHAGDTLRYPGMAAILAPMGIDVALLPINGRRPERRVAGNLWGAQAARLASDIGARLVIPCHFEMFRFNTESPAAFVAACRRLGQPYRLLRCGERLIWSGAAGAGVDCAGCE